MPTNTNQPARVGVDQDELERQIAERTTCQADLWAACIAGASQTDTYLEQIAAAGLELQVLQSHPGYRFTSERAQRTSDKYGAQSISLLALTSLRVSRRTRHSDLGGGADAGGAVSHEGSINNQTEEVSK